LIPTQLPSNLRIPLRVAAIVLLLGIPPIWPYGYYMLLRLVVCVISAYCAYLLRHQKQTLFWLMVLVAFLFNPIALVALPKLVWVPIDLAAAFLFLSLSRHAKTAKVDNG
jgi:hypothetical protein